jgi:probable phosphomutase (TIGR03848 family)
MPVVLLIRHGENEYVKKGRLAGRLPGVHLNAKGQEQAKALAEKLAGAPIKAVYSSPLERTLETAEPIAAALGLEVIPRMGLVEVDVGDWQNKKLKHLSRLKIWRTVQNRPSIMRFPGGESFAEAQHRIYQEIDILCSQHDAKDIFACVLHSDPIKLAVAYFIGLPIDMFQRLSIAPASITALYVGETDSRLLTLNYDFSFTLSQPG